MQSNQCNVHDVGRFVGHEKARWAQKRRRGHAKLGLMHHREGGKIYTEIRVNAPKHLPTQAIQGGWSVSLSQCSGFIPAVLLCAFLRCDAADLRGAGAQYGQLGLCAALPPSWMLLLVSGCTASDVTSSLHPSIHTHTHARRNPLRPAAVNPLLSNYSKIYS